LNDPRKSRVYSQQILNEITCVKYSPNGYFIAFGDIQGGVRIVGWSSAENDFMVKFQNDTFLGGQVNDIAWTDDSKKIMVVGGG
jgi:WD40 repeat protein